MSSNQTRKAATNLDNLSSWAKPISAESVLQEMVRVDKWLKNTLPNQSAIKTFPNSAYAKRQLDKISSLIQDLDLNDDDLQETFGE
jgi:ribosome assembly protein YihI (activator of Der GTPase)